MLLVTWTDGQAARTPELRPGGGRTRRHGGSSRLCGGLEEEEQEEADAATRTANYWLPG